MDAILMPEWDYRYFSYNCEWNKNREMASMRNGEGDEYFILFSAEGVAIKVLVKEAPLIDYVAEVRKIPEVFDGFLREPAFSLHLASQYVWCERKDGLWIAAPSITRAIPLLGALSEEFDYVAWASEYYDRAINRLAASRVLEKLDFSKGVVRALNPELDYGDLAADVKEILGKQV